MANPFQTPTNERSFSGLIDAAILATGRPQQLIAAVGFANMVVKECTALGLFARDMVEDGLAVVDGTAPVTMARPAYFRSLRTVKYVNKKVWPKLALPGRKQRDLSDFYYAVDNYFVFSGAGTGETIAMATYYWQKPLGYFGQLGVNTAIFPGGPYDTRPAFYDQDADIWMYLSADGTEYVTTTGDPNVDIARQKLSSNWMTLDWYDLVLSGTKSKMWTSAGDARGSTEYSVYKQFQKILQSSSAYESEDF